MYEDDFNRFEKNKLNVKCISENRYSEDVRKFISDSISTVALNWNNNDSCFVSIRFNANRMCVICSWNPYANKNQWLLRAAIVVCIAYDLIVQ